MNTIQRLVNPLKTYSFFLFGPRGTGKTTLLYISSSEIIKKCLLVSLEELPRLTDDKILILPYKNFLQSLWQGDIF